MSDIPAPVLTLCPESLGFSPTHHPGNKQAFQGPEVLLYLPGTGSTALPSRDRKYCSTFQGPEVLLYLPGTGSTALDPNHTNNPFKRPCVQPPNTNCSSIRPFPLQGWRTEAIQHGVVKAARSQRKGRGPCSFPHSRVTQSAPVLV